MIWIENRARVVNWDGQPVILRTIVDITERKNVEQQLRQVQKIEAVGQLTGGLSHDFNNLLFVILINLQLVADLVREDPKIFKMNDAAIKATYRGAELTERLLAFSRQQILQPENIDVNTVVTETINLLIRTLGETIEIEFQPTPDLWSTWIDRTQLESALVNLSINARDAMPNGGRLTIETANVVVDSDATAGKADFFPGQYVMLSIRDDGIGMPADVLNRVFEPFFSTKAVGAGTGLGLSMVYGFVKQSNGHTEILSGEGHGTTVKVYFPRYRQESFQTEKNADSAADLPAGRESILVVDDEIGVRQGLASLLSQLGYHLLEAENGQAALNVLEENSHIDLILSDVVMPGAVDGPTLAQLVADRRPDIKVLLMSGYVQSALMRNVRPDMEVISKPFDHSMLAQKIRQVLDRPGATA